MNLSYHIARRYLFSKKSHNAVNVISIISVVGIAVATMALVCALSVFNGFTQVVSHSFSAFDPALKVVPVKGKVFDASTPQVDQVRKLEGVDFVSESLEENALLTFGERQEPILLKGVSSNFLDLVDQKKVIIDGQFVLREGDTDYGVIGGGLAVNLGIGANFLEPASIWIPKRNVNVNIANPTDAFVRNDVFISGVFGINQPKYDDQILIVSIDLARELLYYENEVTSLDIKVKEGVSVDDLRKQISSILGKDYLVKDRFEQQADLFRMVSIEKWVTFLILAIILLIAVFNIVGSLSMLIIEKTEDIAILQNLGASNRLITRIFLIEGWLITLFGSLSGLIVGLAVCLLQQHFGLLKLGSTPGEFVIDAYPVAVQLFDVVIIFVTVSIIGFLAVLYPVNTLRKKLAKK